MAEAFDAVCIGSGINALAAALMLSAKGWRVAVFEANAEAGGAVRSGEYTLPGFRHDWAAMNLSLLAGGAFFKAHGEELGRHGLSLVPVSRPFASSFADGWAGVSTDAGETRASLAAHSSRDAEAFLAMAKAFPAEAPHLFGLLGSPMTTRALSGVAWRAWRAKGAAGTLDLGRFLLQSPRAWLCETFESEAVRALLGAWGMHLDFAPDVAGGALFPYLEGMAGHLFGMALAQGGAGAASGAVVAALRARGGVVETGAPVARVLREGDRATGVELADGRRVEARRAVIAGVAPSGLLRLTATAPAFDAALRRFRHAPGTLMVHVALDGPPEWRHAPLKGYAYVHLAPTLDAMARAYAEAQAGLLPAEPVVVVGQPTVFDPSRAPEGRHVLWVQVRMAPGTVRGDARGEIAATSWEEAGGPFAERVLAILECHAPGTRAKVLGMRVVTPLDLERDNPNLVGGDQVTGSHHLSQHFLFRPARGHADGSTPIRNLHMTGAAVWPGAGTGAGAGFLLARRLAR